MNFIIPLAFYAHKLPEDDQYMSEL